MSKGLGWDDIVSLIKEFGIEPKVSPDGIEIGSKFENGISIRYRFENGSGIAGQSRIWWLKPIAHGVWNKGTEKCETKTAIRKVLREWIRKTK